MIGVLMEINKTHLIDIKEGLRQLDRECADIIIVDPPYNIGKDFGICKDNLNFQEYLYWCDCWIYECLRVLKNSGTMFIYGLSETLAYIFVNIDLNKKWLIWSYKNKAVPSLNFWQRSHESIIAVWKENRTFNRDLVREPYTEIFLKNAAGRTRNKTKGRFSNGEKETVYVAHKDGALPRDVIQIPALAGGAGRKERWFYCKTCNGTFFPNDKTHNDHEIIKHPTQKPLALTRKLLLSCKPENNGFVVVPFAGSGSEVFCAKELNMDFIGFDINEDYVNMANSLIGV